MSQPSRTIAWSLLPLLALAGATDALMIVHSKDLLAVYMTGNSTKLGDFLALAEWARVAEIASVIAMFVFAATFATWLGDRGGRWRASLVLMLVGVLLMLAGPLAAQAPQPYALATVLVVAAAMGALNQVRVDEPGVTFVTGSLVKLGRCLAGGRWLPATDALLRWLCFLAGALAGALIDSHLGTRTLLLLGALATAGAVATWAVQARLQPLNA
ncbi:YoaK family protein [Pseudomonas sp. RIT-To-2]|uniref:YoaK family protein n=1 Tax=Pseudomonas sp. RIT-To-2 TaxID=3462541 RepID=UPI0024139694